MKNASSLVGLTTVINLFVSYLLIVLYLLFAGQPVTHWLTIGGGHNWWSTRWETPIVFPNANSMSLFNRLVVEFCKEQDRERRLDSWFENLLVEIWTLNGVNWYMVSTFGLNLKKKKKKNPNVATKHAKGLHNPPS